MHNFYVGGYFRDRKQGYTVLELSETGMRIRYDDGSIGSLDNSLIDLKFRIYTNIIHDYQLVHPMDTEAYYETLGYLSKVAHFKAEVVKVNFDKFAKNYEKLTGDYVDFTNPDIRLIINLDTWGAAFRINFPISDRVLEFDPEDKILLVTNKQRNTMIISNNPYWSRLISIGFRLGTNHDIDQIRNSISTVDGKNAFNKGRK